MNQLQFFDVGIAPTQKTKAWVASECGRPCDAQVGFDAEHVVQMMGTVNDALIQDIQENLWYYRCMLYLSTVQ